MVYGSPVVMYDCVGIILVPKKLHGIRLCAALPLRVLFLHRLLVSLLGVQFSLCLLCLGCVRSTRRGCTVACLCGRRGVGGGFLRGGRHRNWHVDVLLLRCVVDFEVLFGYDLNV